ncbi:hypothetical protein LTR37_019130 [Vermiconidia calcicola]|uniref:Uncharacterized protein n=1 Tax=Vermiconidia calcicola TaxID=1690605 RepID=A0ACC3MFB3_9PEZI|nr:hypothetical protein LTR37_019130 [Vermiconidia calcicola]
MKLFASRVLSLAVASYAAISCAAPIQDDQTIISLPITLGPWELFKDEKHPLRMNMTFDDVDLNGLASKTLTSFGPIDLDRFEAVNVTAAINKGLMHPKDTDSAVSKPNALHSIPKKIAAPSVLRSNLGILAWMNLSPNFDLVSFAVKPVTDNSEYAWMSVTVWQIDYDEGVPRNFDDIYIYFPSVNGTYDVFDIEPREYFEGWGKNVNYVEFSVEAGDDFKPLDFTIDNIVIDFHKLEEDK